MQNLKKRESIQNDPDKEFQELLQKADRPNSKSNKFCCERGAQIERKKFVKDHKEDPSTQGFGRRHSIQQESARHVRSLKEEK